MATQFQLEGVAFDRSDERRGVRVLIALVGPSGSFDMDIRIIIPETEEFCSSRSIDFIDGRAQLIMTPFGRLQGASEGLILLRIEGQDLPPIPLDHTSAMG